MHDNLHNGEKDGNVSILNEVFRRVLMEVLGKLLVNTSDQPSDAEALRELLPFSQLRLVGYGNSIRIFCCPALSLPYLTLVLSLASKSFLGILSQTHALLFYRALFMSFSEIKWLYFFLSQPHGLCEESAVFTLVAFQGCVNLSHSLAQDQQQGCFLVCLFMMIDLPKNLLSSA